MKKQTYHAPEIKTVEFKVEVGFLGSNPTVAPTPQMRLTGTGYNDGNTEGWANVGWTTGINNN